MKPILLILVLTQSIFGQLKTSEKLLYNNLNHSNNLSYTIPSPRDLTLAIEYSTGFRESSKIDKPLYYSSLKINPEFSFSNDRFRLATNFGICYLNPSFDYSIGGRADVSIINGLLNFRSDISISHYLNENISSAAVDLKLSFGDFVDASLRFNKIFRGSEFLLETSLTFNLDLEN